MVTPHPNPLSFPWAFEDLLIYIRDLSEIAGCPEHHVPDSEKEIYEKLLILKILRFEAWVFQNFSLRKFNIVRRTLEELGRFPVGLKLNIVTFIK